MRGRMSRGWQLTKQSWAVIRADRSLVLFPVIGAIAGILCAAVFFGAGAGLIATDVTGAAAVGAIVFVAGFLPGAVLVAGGIALGGPGGIVLAVLGAIVLVVAALLQTTIMAVFKVALFRFATQDQVLGPFDRAQLERAFVPRKASR